MEEAESYCKSLKLIAVDTETRGKSQYRRFSRAALDCHMNQCVMLQIGDERQQFVIDTRFVDISNSLLLKILESTNSTKVLVNAKFDYKVLRQEYGVRLGKIQDLMINEMILNLGTKRPKGYYSFVGLSERYLNYKFRKSNQLGLFESPADKELLTKETRTQFSRISNRPFTLEEVVYGANDVSKPIEIYRKQQIRLQQHKLINTSIFENRFIPTVAEMEIIGFSVDWDRWRKLYENNLKEYLQAKKQLVEEILSNKKLRPFISNQSSLFTETPSVFINWQSSKQVAAICKSLGLEIEILDKEASKLHGTKLYKDSIEERILSQYKDTVPFVSTFLRFKTYQKAVTTYGEKFIKKFKHPVTGRVHSNYRSMVSSGRMASSAPNL